MFSYPHKSKTALAINKGRFLACFLTFQSDNHIRVQFESH